MRRLRPTHVRKGQRNNDVPRGIDGPPSDMSGDNSGVEAGHDQDSDHIECATDLN